MPQAPGVQRAPGPAGPVRGAFWRRCPLGPLCRGEQRGPWERRFLGSRSRVGLDRAFPPLGRGLHLPAARARGGGLPPARACEECRATEPALALQRTRVGVRTPGLLGGRRGCVLITQGSPAPAWLRGLGVVTDRCPHLPALCLAVSFPCASVSSCIKQGGLSGPLTSGVTPGLGV